MLMETIGRTELSHLIVPHCLVPQALCHHDVLFLLLWFPYRNMCFACRKYACQSTGI